MIKIFGKVHYHWQPDLSILVTYWSIAVIPVFIGLALMYESSSVPTLVLFSFFLFMVLLAIGVHRYCMRKWPKKYFINALALNPYFKGEVILTDNFIHVDYYEMYYANK